MPILVLLETENGSIKKISQEAIAYAAAVASPTQDKVIALALGSTDTASLALAGNFGATTVYHITDERFNHENNMAYANALAQVVEQTGAHLVVAARSGLGDAVAARASARLNAGIVSGVTSLPEVNGDKLSVQKAIYSGKAFARMELTTPVKFLLIRKNVIDFTENDNQVTVETIEVNVDEQDFAATITGTDKATTELSLTDADVIVSGGRGMKGPEHWQSLLDLARALGAATGCSKPVSDMDWRPHHEHIGQTGIKVAPNLYIACGISGAIQHLAGVNGSKCIVVINKDPEAPFFKEADYGIVGDVFEILPRLTKAAEALK